MSTYTHTYPTRLDADVWHDLQSVKKMDARSINSLLNEGAREVVKKKQIELADYRKHRETIRSVAAVR